MRTIIATATMILLFGMISEAQLSGVKKGLCVKVSGTIMRKLTSKDTYTIQLDYSSQTDDIVVIMSVPSENPVGKHIEETFMTSGVDVPLKFQDDNGNIKERNLPIFEYSKKCEKVLKDAGK